MSKHKHGHKDSSDPARPTVELRGTAPGAPPQPGPPARSRFPGPGQGRTPFPQSAPPKRFIRKVPGM